MSGNELENNLEGDKLEGNKKGTRHSNLDGSNKSTQVDPSSVDDITPAAV